MSLVHLAALAICIVGFAALALASGRQQDDLFGRPLAPRWTSIFRLVGWTALAAALAALVRSQGWGMALVSYSGHTSLAAGLVFGALIVRERLRGR